MLRRCGSCAPYSGPAISPRQAATRHRIRTRQDCTADLLCLPGFRRRCGSRAPYYCPALALQPVGTRSLSRAIRSPATFPGHQPCQDAQDNGEVAGGVHCNNRLGGNSLLDCVVFGRAAGKAAAQYVLDKDVKDKDLMATTRGRTGAVEGSKWCSRGPGTSSRLLGGPRQGHPHGIRLRRLHRHGLRQLAALAPP